jgi:hypothetical protein
MTMSASTESPPTTRRWSAGLIAQLIALLAFVVFSVIFAVAIRHLGSSARNYPMVVLLLGILAAGFGAVAVVRGERRSRPASDEGADAPGAQAAVHPAASEQGEEDAELPRGRVNAIVVVSGVLMIAFVQATQVIGLVWATLIYTPLQMLLLGERTWWRLAVIAVAVPVVILVVLNRLLLIPLPA